VSQPGQGKTTTRPVERSGRSSPVGVNRPCRECEPLACVATLSIGGSYTRSQFAECCLNGLPASRALALAGLHISSSSGSFPLTQFQLPRRRAGSSCPMRAPPSPGQQPGCCSVLKYSEACAPRHHRFPDRDEQWPRRFSITASRAATSTQQPSVPGANNACENLVRGLGSEEPRRLVSLCTRRLPFPACGLGASHPLQPHKGFGTSATGMRQYRRTGGAVVDSSQCHTPQRWQWQIGCQALSTRLQRKRAK